jgi:hypothetical protein
MMSSLDRRSPLRDGIGANEPINCIATNHDSRNRVKNIYIEVVIIDVAAITIVVLREQTLVPVSLLQ